MCRERDSQWDKRDYDLVSSWTFKQIGSASIIRLNGVPPVCSMKFSVRQHSEHDNRQVLSPSLRELWSALTQTVSLLNLNLRGRDGSPFSQYNFTVTLLKQRKIEPRIRNLKKENLCYSWRFLLIYFPGRIRPNLLESPYCLENVSLILSPDHLLTTWLQKKERQKRKKGSTIVALPYEYNAG